MFLPYIVNILNGVGSGIFGFLSWVFIILTNVHKSKNAESSKYPNRLLKTLKFVYIFYYTKTPEAGINFLYWCFMLLKYYRLEYLLDKRGLFGPLSSSHMWQQLLNAVVHGFKPRQDHRHLFPPLRHWNSCTGLQTDLTLMNLGWHHLGLPSS